MRKFAIIVACALSASGCAHTGQSFSLAPKSQQAQPLAFSNRAVTRSTDKIESALGALYTRASLFEEPKTGSADWDKVILAAMDFVDDGCNEYLTQAYLAARDQKSTPFRSSSIARSFEEDRLNKASFSGPEAAGEAGAATVRKETEDRRDKRALGLEAAFFHAANEDSRERYRKKTFSDRQQAKRREKFGALSAMRGYLALCSPARVEAQLFEATYKPKKSRR